jgi:hypothetical protein
VLLAERSLRQVYRPRARCFLESCCDGSTPLRGTRRAYVGAASLEVPVALAFLLLLFIALVLLLLVPAVSGMRSSSSTR